MHLYLYVRHFAIVNSSDQTTGIACVNAEIHIYIVCAGSGPSNLTGVP